VIDDPQTDASARSEKQCTRRVGVLKDAILGLAGPGKTMAAVMPCTVIVPQDMADQILDREKYPQWQGLRTKMLYSFPTNMELWEEYWRLACEGFKAGKGLKKAIAYYKANRAAMDAGGKVGWEARKTAEDLSALQHAMTLYLANPAGFMAEYQNEPELPAEDGEQPKPETILAKFNRTPRGILPAGMHHLVAYVDVQKTLLYFVVMAWRKDFSGHVVDYGSYPGQGRRTYWKLGDVRHTIDKAHPGMGLEGRLYAALSALTDDLLGREWQVDGGAVRRIERLLIDANWGESTEVVYQFCRESKWAALLLPGHGRSVGPTKKPYSEYRQEGDWVIGHHWLLPDVKKKRVIRHVLIDTYYWKSFVHEGFATAAGDPRSITLFGDDPALHRMYAEQLCSETRKPVHYRDRRVDVWELPAHKPDNHFLDCTVGCAVAASMCGCEPPGPGGKAAAPGTRTAAASAEPVRRRRISYFH
jgi:hypothetical protein